MNKPLILVVEDDPAVARLISTTLETRNYQYHRVQNGAGALLEAASARPDVILLDLGLPDMDGIDVIRKIRGWSNVPILVVSARSDDTDKVSALDAGADDYLTKPFKLGVLLSRVNALLRRANASSAGEPVLESGSITVRLLQGQAYKNGILLELTGAEYKLLCFFMQHPNAVLSKEQILDALWDCDGDYIDSSALTVYIRRLRMKIEDDPGKPQMLLTVRGMGYKWNG
jgi:DNA-binding response OmpR family regulator